MSDDPVILTRNSEEVATCIFNRPKKRNALSIEMMQRLCAHVEEVQKDPKIRVLVLRGNGPVFSAGLDLVEVMDPKLRIESATMVKRSLLAIYQAPIVTIAMVHGAAMGGGAGFVAACDFAVADKEALIGFPEIHHGLIAAQVMSVLIRRLRRGDVKEILLSGDSIVAARALQMGLFNRVGDIEIEAEKLIAQVLRGSPQAIARTKRLLDDLYGSDLQDDLEMCLLSYLQTSEGEEAGEGIRAFMEQRKPMWEKP
jgi:methylglutaconyl-CoA hydratase